MVTIPECRVRPVLSILLAVALVSIFPATGAFHDPDGAELVDERTIEGPFWFVYRVSVSAPDTVVSFEIQPESEDRAQTGYGLWVMPVDGDRRPFFFIGTGGPAVTEVDVRWDEPVPVEEQTGPHFGASGPTNGFAYTGTDLPVDDYWLVLVNTARYATTADVKLYLSEDAALVATAQGATGDLHRETEFETDEPYTHVRVGASVGTNPQAQWHELRDANRTLTIENHLFGIFRASGGDPNDFSHIMPDAEERRNTVLTKYPAGDYEFRVNEWVVEPRVGVGLNAYVALLWADVALP